MTQETETLARMMFNAYGEHCGWKAWDGRPMPKWSASDWPEGTPDAERREVNEPVRSHWHAAAGVAIALREDAIRDEREHWAGELAQINRELNETEESNASERVFIDSVVDGLRSTVAEVERERDALARRVKAWEEGEAEDALQETSLRVRIAELERERATLKLLCVEGDASRQVLESALRSLGWDGKQDPGHFATELAELRLYGFGDRHDARAVDDILAERGRQEAKFPGQVCPATAVQREPDYYDRVRAHAGPCWYACDAANLPAEEDAKSAVAEGLDWSRILVEEVAEAVGAGGRGDALACRTELVQVAATAVRWIGAIERGECGLPALPVTEPASADQDTPEGAAAAKRAGNSEPMTREDLERLDEYSLSLPTGTTIGKRWRRRVGNGWYIGEYVAHEDPTLVGIRWTPVVIVDTEQQRPPEDMRRGEDIPADLAPDDGPYVCPDCYAVAGPHAKDCAELRRQEQEMDTGDGSDDR